MKVLSLYHAPLRSTSPEEQLSEAAARMAFYEIGALAVMDQGYLIGIFTERDVVRAVGDEADPRDATVGEYMTPGPISIAADEDATDAARRMLAIGVRHLPVVDQGTVVGMLSARDVFGQPIEKI